MGGGELKGLFERGIFEKEKLSVMIKQMGLQSNGRGFKYLTVTL